MEVLAIYWYSIIKVHSGTKASQPYAIIKEGAHSLYIETQSFVLNFNGRVTQASVKNFQIVHDNDRKSPFTKKKNSVGTY
jgi:hypothetical protein